MFLPVVMVFQVEWLHYGENDDMVICHLCVTALVKRAVKWNKAEAAFASKGYCNWKDAIVAFGKQTAM